MELLNLAPIILVVAPLWAHIFYQETDLQTRLDKEVANKV